MKVCPKCGDPLIVNEYKNYVWECFRCGLILGPAITEEIDNETEWYTQTRKKDKRVSNEN